MPDRPISEPASAPQRGAIPESDLGELAALFAAHGGGNLSAEVSADLALEIVLNEIVGQACFATGATGAAIMLERDGEMVCRASSGVNAPELGVRLGGDSGLTAQCIRTRQVQRCEDALTDPRADAEASRSLGVRSVVVLPLLRNDGLAGLVEVFSSRAGAFGERDEITLSALGRRVLKNLERARELSFASSAGSAGVASAGVDASRSEKVYPAAAASEMEYPREGSATVHVEDEIPAESLGRGPRTGFDVATYALGAAVVACAMLLAILVGLRVSSGKRAGVRGTESDSSAAAVGQAGANQESAAQTAGALGSNAVAPPAAVDAAKPMVSVSGKKNASGVSAVAGRGKDNVPPAGGLLVYEDGKEIFRMMPGANGIRTDEGGVQRASAVEPAGFAAAPEGSVVYRVEPEYPKAARRLGMQGAVALDVRIGRDGAVQDVRVASGERLLADAAIAAVKQWKFKPRLVQGKAVEMESRVTLYFRMPE